MSLVESPSSTSNPKISLAAVPTERRPVLISAARKQIERERTRSGKGAVPATDITDDSPELQQALDRIDLDHTAEMSADEKKALEASVHEQAQKKQEDTFMKSTVASDMIFYAFARRTDHKDFSRYLLNFANAGVAQEWWELVHAEYPDTVRHGPQFFSFKGDDLPGRVWSNKKFEHLSSKWFWTRMDDTGGRQQPIIPLQDAKGYVIGSTTNTNTAYVGTSIHSSSQISSSENSSTALNSASATSAGGSIGGNVAISAELSTIISEQALHLKEVQQLIAAQSAQIAAWGQLLAVLLQGGQFTSIQSLQGTEVGANLSQIIASLKLTGGVFQTTNGTSGSAAVGGLVGGSQGIDTTKDSVVGGLNNGTTTTGGNLDLSKGISSGTGGSFAAGTGQITGAVGSKGTQVLPAVGGGSNKAETTGNTTVGTGNLGSVNGSVGDANFSSSIQVAAATAAAEASSTGHASGYASGHAAGFAAGLQACQSASHSVGQTASIGGGNSLSASGGQNGARTETTQGGGSSSFNIHYPGQAQQTSPGGGSYGTSIHISGGEPGVQGGTISSSGGQGSSWDQMTAKQANFGTPAYASGNWQSGTSSLTGGGLNFGSGSSGWSYGSGNSSGSTTLSASITAGQGGTVNAGRMTFNGTTFSAAIADVATRRANYLIQIGDRRSFTDVYKGILVSCLREGQQILSSGVGTQVSASIIEGQAGQVNAGQMIISDLTFGAFVDKAANLRTQQLTRLGDQRAPKEIYTGVYAALLGELQEFMATLP